MTRDNQIIVEMSRSSKPDFNGFNVLLSEKDDVNDIIQVVRLGRDGNLSVSTTVLFYLTSVFVYQLECFLCIQKIGMSSYRSLK